MIDSIRGILVEKQPTQAIVEAGGFGWQVPITLSTFDRLPAAGETIHLITHLAVREDSLTLYGFWDATERNLFERLLQVNGIGPKLAMTVLSGLPGTAIVQAIADGDVKRLSSIPGIGKKMAERMVLELKDKLQAEAGAPDTGPEGSGDSKPTRDAVLALVALGYKQQEARKLLDKIPLKERASASVEDLVRRALQSG